jgi:hypothetical protein
MHLTPKYINIIINILLGAAWATALYGFFYGFFYTNSNIFFKVVSGLIHSTLGLFLVLVLEVVYRFFINHELLKEQTKLLKELKND